MISIVLIEPENSANVGSIARVMANFNVKNLYLVDSKCEINEDSKKLAKNAQDVLKKAKNISFNGLKKFDYLIATTAKLGNDYNIPRSPLSPSQLSEKLSKVKNKKIALVIGRESHGLSNEEIEMCDFLVSIPTHKDYRALNISHAVAIILYEIFKKESSKKMLKPYTPISAGEKERILKLLEEKMENLKFSTQEKKQTQVKVWKRMISKSFMTKREAMALIGFLKKIK
jgi:tRNA/rRNA methyltransferase